MQSEYRSRPSRHPSSGVHSQSRRAGEYRMADEKEEPYLFDFSMFFYHFRTGCARFGWLVILFVSVCTGLLCFRTIRSYTPLYKTDTILTVNVDISSTTNFYNATTARQMANTFPYILSSTQLCDIVAEDLGVEMLDASISATAVEDTNLFTLTVTSRDPQHAYDVLLSVLENYPQIAEYVIGSTQLRLIAEPQVPTVPVNPMNLRGAVFKGILAGIVLTAAVITGYALLDLTIINAAGIEHKLHGKCLVRIPAADPLEKKKKKDRKRQNLIFDIRDKHLNPAFYESLRSLRHDVQRLCRARGHKIIMMTSTSSNEGKSTVSINLAMTLSQTGARVLLIDCDLRKPALKYHIGYEGKAPGLAAVLSKQVSFRDAVAVLPGSNLHVLLSDASTEHAAELFGTPAMDAFLTSLRDVYDYVILDTAPVALVSDTTQLARHADCMLYVIRQDYVFTSNIYEAVRQLSSSGIDMLGFVLNITRRSGSSARYGYGYSVYGKYGKYGNYGKYGKYGSHSSEKTETEINE